MPNYEVVSKEIHKSQRWKPSSNFKFASQDAMCPLILQELPKAALHLPITFSKTGSTFGLFAVQGLEAGSNYLVDEAGVWLAGYMPIAYRGYPFALATSDEDQQVLCVDVESGLLGNIEGHDFFDSEGEPSIHIKEILNLLSQISDNRNATLSLCLLLEQLDLLEQWPVSVTKEEKETKVDGLYRVNEAKFNSLEAESLMLLRDKGALPLIFCQLLSMQNLARIAQWGNPQSSPSALPEELDFDFSKDGGSISFEGL